MRRNFFNEANEPWPSENSAAEILELLSGFPGYPRTEKGRELFVKALCRAETIEIAKWTIEKFDEAFPTLKQLRDAIESATNDLRPKDYAPDLRKQWIAEGCEHDPDWFPNLLRDVLEEKHQRDLAKREDQLKQIRDGIAAIEKKKADFDQSVSRMEVGDRPL